MPTTVENENNAGRELNRLWDRYAPYYKGPLSTPEVQKMGRALIESIHPCPGGIVHDAGCGIGYWLMPILEQTQASKVIGTDYSKNMLDWAKEELARQDSFGNKIELRQMDLTKEWPQEIFDAQVFNLFLYYLPHHEWEGVLEKAFQSTKPEGYVYSSILVKGFSVEKAGKKYLLRQLLLTPPLAIPLLVKAMPIIREIDKFVDRGVVEFPDEEEFIDYHRQVGFSKVEVVNRFLDGMEIVTRAQKPA